MSRRFTGSHRDSGRLRGSDGPTKEISHRARGRVPAAREDTRELLQMPLMMLLQCLLLQVLLLQLLRLLLLLLLLLL